MNGSDNVRWLNGHVRPTAAFNYYQHSDFSLPQFDGSTGINPVYHLTQLDKFMSVKSIPHSHQLSITCKSVVGTLSKQLIEAIRHSLTDYSGFRTEFLSTWWSAAEQGLSKCRLYQSKYDRQSGLSLSAHLLKFATLASYLEPRTSNTEVIEASRYHYPVFVQRIMLSTLLRSIGEALNLLKRVGVMESYENFRPASPFSRDSQQNAEKKNHNPRGNYNHRHNQHQVRSMQVSQA
jgi:hypothetical protein